MNGETRIIIKQRLIKFAKDSFNGGSDEEVKFRRMTFMWGARKLLLLLAENNILDFSDNEIKSLSDDLDLNKIKL